MDSLVKQKKNIRNLDNTRRHRRQQQRYSSISLNQRYIPQYFPLIDQIGTLILENNNLNNILSSFLESQDSNLQKSQSVTNNEITDHSHFLKKLFERANNHSGSYDKSLSLFCSYLYTIGGRLLYDTLYANLPIPSPSTVSRVISNTVCHVREGICRFRELKEFLTTRGLPLIVWLSEDATRIVQRVQYDPKTNELVGFVLPLSQTTGMPESGKFTANSASEIEKHFLSEKTASLVYTIMAQSLQENSSTFCLCVFGTDNKFNFKHVHDRWKFICEGLENEGIKVFGIGSDGDSRLLKTMRIVSQLNLKKSEHVDSTGLKTFIPYFHASFTSKILCMQDHTHIGAKLRVRFLKHSILLPLGNFIVSSTHLRMLMEKLSKDKHLLNEKDLSLKDKMNYDSVRKISDPRLVKLLQENVPMSDGTILYLQIIHLFLSAFLDKELSPSDRIYNAWYTVFILRYWRHWLTKSTKYSVTDNFISSNCYMCMELDAHNLVNCILQLKELNDQGFHDAKLFVPWIFGSQACESFYRRLRSMSTTNSTIVNCSLLETVHRILRIQFQEDVTAGKLDKNSSLFNFPRSGQSRQAEKNNKRNFELVGIDEIVKIMDRAKKDAFNKVKSLGVNVNIQDCHSISIKSLVSDEEKEKNLNIDQENEIDSDEDDDLYDEEQCEDDDKVDQEFNSIDDESSGEILTDLSVLSSIEGDLELKSISNLNVNVDKNSPFVVVRDTGGNGVIVRKSSICWLLNKGGGKLSSDRLQRVRDEEITKSTSHRKIPKDKTAFLKENEEINIGDWCLFKEENFPSCMIGSVLSFVYLEGKTLKAQEYSSSFAKISGNKKQIGVLCNWFVLRKKSNILVPEPMTTHGYININQYRKTVSPPIITVGGALKVDDSIYQEIKKYF